MKTLLLIGAGIAALYFLGKKGNVDTSGSSHALTPGVVPLTAAQILALKKTKMVILSKK